jgi:DNA polymerase-3 subunit delta
MITTLTGANNYALLAKLRQLVASFVAENGDLALERIDGQETELAKISEALHGLPFLSNKKLVVLRQPGANKQFAETAEQILDNLPETTDVILVEPKLDKRLTYYKFLKKNTDFVEFTELDQNGLVQYLAGAARENGGIINAADARYLVERVGTNQQMLSSELDKLLLYDNKITRQTIDLLTDSTPQSTIFELLEAAFAGQTKKTLNLYAQQRAMKVEPQQIIAMLAWQLHILAVIKTAGDRSADQIASDAKLNPFVVRKSQGIARDLSRTQVKNLVSDLLDIDIATKSTNIDIDEALQHYLLKLAT